VTTSMMLVAEYTMLHLRYRKRKITEHTLQIRLPMQYKPYIANNFQIV